MTRPVSGSRPSVYRPYQRPYFCLRRLPSPFALRFAMVLIPPSQQHNIPQKEENSQANGAELTGYYHLPFLCFQHIISRSARKALSLFYAAQDLRTQAGKGVPSPNASTAAAKKAGTAWEH